MKNKIRDFEFYLSTYLRFKKRGGVKRKASMVVKRPAVRSLPNVLVVRIAPEA